MITVFSLAERLGGEVVGDGSSPITGFASADQAQAGDLTFAENSVYLEAAERSQATAVLAPRGSVSTSKILIRVDSPRVAMAIAIPLFYPDDPYPPGIHSTAAIDPTATIHPTAHVGPHCVIGAGVSIGEHSVLMGGNHIGHASRIGNEVHLHPNVVIYSRTEIHDRVRIHSGTTIGSDGYGYVFDQGRHRKIPQIGNVVIHEDVEIGSNTSIDRGALGSTVIGQGTKIDNLVHIAHNVVIGRHCLILGQVGFAGSTQLSDYVVVAAQSGIAGHLKVGNQAVIGAKSGVMRDVAPGETVLGYPAVSDRQAKRQWIATGQMPDALRRLKALEKQLDSYRE